MTSINVLPLPQHNVAYIFSDGASYDLDGVIQSIGSKSEIMPSLSCAMMFSGRAIISPYIAHHLEHQASSFDHLMEIMPTRLEAMIEHLTDLFGPDRSSEARGQAQGFRAFVAGWSERRGQPVAFSISSVRDAAGRAPFELYEAPGGFQAPGVSKQQSQLGFGGSPVVTPDTIEDVAVTMIELLRQEPFPEMGGQYCVGGLVELVTVRRDSITSKILKRWDEDVVGQKLSPSPVDWPAYRARRLAASASNIPEGLSRLQRERMEKKARKGTLRKA